MSAVVLIALVLTLPSEPPLVLVDSELGAACLAGTSGVTVREVHLAEDTELAAERTFIDQARTSWSEGQQLAFRLETKAAQAKLEEALALFGRGAPALDDFADYARALI